MSEPISASPDEQYAALRSGRAFAELLGWSSICVTGADRQTFLHNFCTNDIKRLAPGESCEAFFTNVKGKIVGHGLVCCKQTEFVIIGVPGQAERLIPQLDRYVIRDDVELRNTTDERGLVLTSGAVRVASRSAFDWPLLGLIPGRVTMVDQASVDDACRRLRDAGQVEIDINTFTTVRIESGTPLLDQDFDENNLPQEVGRDRQAISFTKGCYLGQETVARIDALGHVNQQIVSVKFSGRDVPPRGTELTHNGAEVGRVTSAAMSPALRMPLALAMVRRGHQEAGSRFQSPLGACEVVVPPLASYAPVASPDANWGWRAAIGQLSANCTRSANFARGLLHSGLWEAGPQSIAARPATRTSTFPNGRPSRRGNLVALRR